jgi:hypothetical protein
MTFSPRALIVFLAFAGVLLLALEPRFGILAIVAAAIVELLLWSGMFGLGRTTESNHG